MTDSGIVVPVTGTGFAAIVSAASQQHGLSLGTGETLPLPLAPPRSKFLDLEVMDTGRKRSGSTTARRRKKSVTSAGSPAMTPSTPLAGALPSSLALNASQTDTTPPSAPATPSGALPGTPQLGPSAAASPAGAGSGGMTSPASGRFRRFDSSHTHASAQGHSLADGAPGLPLPALPPATPAAGPALLQLQPLPLASSSSSSSSGAPLLPLPVPVPATPSSASVSATGFSFGSPAASAAPAGSPGMFSARSIFGSLPAGAAPAAGSVGTPRLGALPATPSRGSFSLLPAAHTGAAGSPAVGPASAAGGLTFLSLASSPHVGAAPGAPGSPAGFSLLSGTAGTVSNGGFSGYFSPSAVPTAPAMPSTGAATASGAGTDAGAGAGAGTGVGDAPTLSTPMLSPASSNRSRRTKSISRATASAAAVAATAAAGASLSLDGTPPHTPQAPQNLLQAPLLPLPLPAMTASASGVSTGSGSTAGAVMVPPGTPLTGPGAPGAAVLGTTPGRPDWSPPSSVLDGMPVGAPAQSLPALPALPQAVVVQAYSMSAPPSAAAGFAASAGEPLVSARSFKSVTLVDSGAAARRSRFTTTVEPHSSVDSLKAALTAATSAAAHAAAMSSPGTAPPAAAEAAALTFALGAQSADGVRWEGTLRRSSRQMRRVQVVRFALPPSPTRAKSKCPVFAPSHSYTNAGTDARDTFSLPIAEDPTLTASSSFHAALAPPADPATAAGIDGHASAAAALASARRGSLTGPNGPAGAGAAPGTPPRPQTPSRSARTGSVLGRDASSAALAAAAAAAAPVPPGSFVPRAIPYDVAASAARTRYARTLVRPLDHYVNVDDAGRARRSSVLAGTVALPLPYSASAIASTSAIPVGAAPAGAPFVADLAATVGAGGAGAGTGAGVVMTGATVPPGAVERERVKSGRLSLAGDASSAMAAAAATAAAPLQAFSEGSLRSSMSFLRMSAFRTEELSFLQQEATAPADAATAAELTRQALSLRPVLCNPFPAAVVARVQQDMALLETNARAVIARMRQGCFVYKYKDFKPTRRFLYLSADCQSICWRALSSKEEKQMRALDEASEANKPVSEGTAAAKESSWLFGKSAKTVALADVMLLYYGPYFGKGFSVFVRGCDAALSKAWHSLSVETTGETLNLVFPTLADATLWSLGIQWLAPASFRAFSMGKLLWMRVIMKINFIGFTNFVRNKNKDWSSLVNRPGIIDSNELGKI
jgi:hypothetical protein